MRQRIGLPNVIATLRQLWNDVRADLRVELLRGTTGRRWRRVDRTCPPWCAGDHTCSAREGHPSGVHRSPPTTWDRWWGRLVATRVAALHTRPWLELRTVVWLDGIDDGHAFDQARYLPDALDHAVAATLADVAAWHVRRPVPGAHLSALPAAARHSVIDGVMLYEERYS